MKANAIAAGIGVAIGAACVVALALILATQIERDL